MQHSLVDLRFFVRTRLTALLYTTILYEELNECRRQQQLVAQRTLWLPYLWLHLDVYTPHLTMYPHYETCFIFFIYFFCCWFFYFMYFRSSWFALPHSSSFSSPTYTTYTYELSLCAYDGSKIETWVTAGGRKSRWVFRRIFTGASETRSSWKLRRENS